jgi:phosphopantetheine adenylyltransferase
MDDEDQSIQLRMHLVRGLREAEDYMAESELHLFVMISAIFFSTMLLFV